MSRLKRDKAAFFFNLNESYFNMTELRMGIELLTILTLEGVAERTPHYCELKRKLSRGRKLHSDS